MAYSPPQKISAKEAAIQLLSRRDHGRYELEQKLLLKGFEPQDVAATLSLCAEYGYLDDRRFAQAQLRQHLYKGHGERRIRQELQQKRVDDTIIAAVLDEAEVDWFELARTTAKKKFKGRIAMDAKDYAKQVRFLQYRGFDFEQIRYALAKEDHQ
ncbi:recombination regulator RecX [Vibrio sp. SM6]|uniref:Regulatory protein RecX n=1 Tax=Vibrio agarilyticus TaxID=2726741 RepID=A0A7X8YGV7_9VIBR|nr:recombination regulator RecX [Vibrio agarilyticus]NLS12821.1 recombination regulator RecX [Vibrio agarilyticus]